MVSTPEGISRSDVIRCVDHVICSRQTRKMLGQVDVSWQHPLDQSDRLQRLFGEHVQSAIALAGWAPFHHSRKALDVYGESVIHEPWRFYYLDRAACLTLLAKIDEVFDPSVRRGKVPSLLAATGALVQVTWLPELPTTFAKPGEVPLEEARIDDQRRLRNQEHLAATAAAVQNLLLAAVARGLETYWSSGGLLREEKTFHLLGIPTTEQLLASVFLAPPLVDYAGDVETKPGALRESRAKADHWCRRVIL